MRALPSFIALRAFESAARLGSFALAGAELGLTPSAISHQIRGLEAHFGEKLFVRGHRRVEVTAAGQVLAGRLSRAFDEIEAACGALGGGPETLALHCAPSFASEWLGPRLASFLAAEKGIGIALAASAAPIEELRREAFDMAIVYGTAPSRPDLLVEPLGVERMTAMVAPALAGADPAGLVLIRSLLRPVRWADWFRLNGLAAPAAVTATGAQPSFDRAALAIAAAAQGIGAVLESTRLAARRLAAGELVPLGPYRAIERPLHFLCVRASQGERPAIRRFRSWLLEEIRRSEISA